MSMTTADKRKAFVSDHFILVIKNEKHKLDPNDGHDSPFFEKLLHFRNVNQPKRVTFTVTIFSLVEITIFWRQESRKPTRIQNN